MPNSQAAYLSWIVSSLRHYAIHRSTWLLLIFVSAGAAIGLSFATRELASEKRVTGTLVAEKKVTVQAAGRGKPFFNFRDGRGMTIDYTGNQQFVAALQDGSASPRALASADLDQNGTPDVMAGYALNGAGLITVQRGNPDAFAPADESVFPRLQQGYNPEPLLPGAAVIPVPVAADFLFAGEFNQSGGKDILVAAKGGGLYLLAGDGAGGFGAPQEITLPGVVTSLATGEFRAADGVADIAVGVSGPGGDSLLIFDDGAQGFSNPVVQQRLSASATAIQFGGLDDDPFQDVAVTSGNEVLIVHGWGRKESVAPESRVERINVGANLQGLALGEFEWDRQGRSEIAALSDDGTIHLVQKNDADTRPFSSEESAQRTRGSFRATGGSVDLESVPSWRAGNSDGWREYNSLRTISTGVGNASIPLVKTNLAFRELNDLILVGQSQSRLEIVHPTAPSEKGLDQVLAASSENNLNTTTLDTGSTPVAVLTLPKKLNGETDVVILNSGSAAPSIVPNPPNTTITVDRTDDPSGAALTAASACTAAANDCSLRGALQFANNAANNNTTISLPANTYILSINGTGAGGCDGNTVGDLGANQTMSITGAGAATTIIRQTGTGPANDGDRGMCMNEPFTLNLIYNFSGFTMVGGRDGTAAGTGTALGGGGIIGGEKGNVLTLSSVVLANNQVTVLGSANIGGGGIQWTGGDLNVTNCTVGGTSAPGAYTDRTSTNTANLQGGSGGGVMFTPSAPQHTASTGILTVSGSTISRNTAGSIGAGGGGLDVLVFAFAAPGGGGTGSATIGTSTISNNSANPGNGGGIINESIATTVATTSITSNSAGNRGGGIFVGGASLLLNGTSPSITFTGNTAVNGGSSVSTSSAVNVDGTNTTIGGDIEINTLGSWTNNTGSTLAPTNVIVTGGTFNMNNSTMNVANDLTIGPGPVVGSTFNGNSGTVNIQGDFVLTAGGAPATTLNAGTGTFNFNGTSAQSISNGTAITFNNLTDSNTTNPVTANNSFAVNGSLNVNGANAIFAPVAAAVISGSGTLTGTGTARVTRTAATADFLSQYTITNKTLTNLTVEYIGAAAQVLSAFTFGPLKINNASGVNLATGTSTVGGLLTLTTGALGVGNQTLVLNDGSSVGAGSITSNPTGTVNYNQSSDGQNVRPFNYGNLTFSNFNKVLESTGTIGIAGVFTTGSATGHTITGSTVNFNGTGAQTIPAFNFNNLTTSGARTTNSITLANGGSIGVAAIFNPTATFTSGNYIITNNTIDFNGGGSQTVPAFNYFNLTSSNSGARTLANSGLIGIASVFTPGTNVYTITGSTVVYNGTSAQTMPSGFTTYNNLTLNNTAGVTPFAGLTVNALLRVQAGTFTSNAATYKDVQIDSGTTLGGTSATTINVSGNWTNNGSYNANSNLVNFNGSTAQALNGANATTFNDLTINNSASTVTVNNIVAAVVDASVGGALTLTTDLTIAASAVVQQSGTSAGTGDAIGTVRRTDLGASTRAFGSPLNTIAINSGTAPTQMDFNLVKSAPGAFAAAVTRTYTLTPTGGAGISATLALHYLDSELNGNTEANLGLWRGTPFTSLGRTSIDTVNNQVTLSGVTGFSPWTLAAMPDVTVTVSPSSVKEDGATNLVYTFSRNGNTAGALTINFSVGGTATFNTDYTASGADTFTSSAGTATFLAGNSTVAVTVDPSVDTTPEVNKTVDLTVTAGTGYNVGGTSLASGTITDDDTTTTITSDNPDPSAVAQVVNVTYTVTAANGGTPTGNVLVSDSVDSNTCTVAAGTCPLTLNTSGNRTITATYQGDANYVAGSQDTEAHVVCVTQIVANTNDSGAGSLRQAIADACDGSTITFAIPAADPGHVAGVYTISLTSAELAISKNLTINGPNTGANTDPIVITGNDARRIFNVGQNLTVNLSNLTATHGSSGISSGGAIVNNDGSTLTLTNMTITASTGGGGGGVGNICSTPANPTLIIKNSTISGNTATGLVGGGGIYHECSGFLYVDNSTIDGNNSTSTGGGAYGAGGISINAGAKAYISNSTISNNTAAAQAGGLFSGNSVASDVQLINMTVSGNSTNGDGGGLYARATLVNSTVTNNRADADDNAGGSGGGIFVQVLSVSLLNTIVAGNFSGTAAPVASDIAGSGTASGSFNLIGPGGSGGLTNGVNNNQVGVAAGLGGLANNGGSTLTHALLGTSTAIEAGTDLTTLSGNGGSINNSTTTVLVADASAIPDKVNFVIQVESEQMTVTAKSSNTLTVVRGANGTTAVTHNDGVAVNPAFDQRGSGFLRKADSADANTTQTVDIGAFELHPSVEDITDKSTAEDTPFNFNFSLGDGTTTPSLISTVTATSSNTTLIPNANLSVTGAGSTRNLAITPAADANSPADGTATITVTVTATNGRTATDTFVVTVTEVNDNPGAVNDTLTAVDEDSGLRVIPFGDLTGNDTKGPANENGQTLTVTNVANPVGGTVQINGTNVEFTPTANFFGTASFDYTITDNGTTNGVADPKTSSGAASFTVNAINDPPSFVIGGNPPAVNEDAGAQTVNSFATSISSGPGEGQVLTFNLSPTGTTGTLAFSSGPAIDSTTGNLTYTTSANTFGTATFSVTLSDNGPGAPPPNSNTSGAQSFTITVNAVADTPSITAATTNEDTQSASGLVISRNAGDGVEVTHFKITNIQNGTLFQNNGTTAINAGDFITFAEGNAGLKFTPNTDFNDLIGTASFDVQASLNNTNGGLGGAVVTRSVTVNAVNDVPSFTKGPDQSVVINAGAQSVTNWATSISRGPATATDEAGQVLNFIVSNNNPALFSAQPAVSPSGTLTYTPAVGMSGSATVDVSLHDNGGTANGGVDTSAVQQFTINVSPPSLKAQDALRAEPASGTANMLFSVVLTPALVGTVTVNYQTNTGGANPATSGTCGNPGVDFQPTSGTLTFSPGETVKTVPVVICSDGASEPDETLLLDLSGPSGATISDSQGVGVIKQANLPGVLLISEIRTSGPAGAGDDFVELYNNQDSPLTVAASDASGGYGVFKMGADCNATPVLIGVIPNGTVIPPRGHYLLVGSAYSLSAYAAGNLTMSSDIENDRNVAVFNTADATNLSTVTSLDGVGFGLNTNTGAGTPNGVCDLLREGTNLPAASGSTLQYSFFRKECDNLGAGCTVPGIAKDTNNNSADFHFADTMGTVTPMGQLLGTPGPQNLSSGTQRNATIVLPLLDSTVNQNLAPNRVRDLTPNTPNATVGPNGTLTFQRRVQNNTGGAVTALRFRVIDITTLPPASPTEADLRAVTSSDVAVSNIHDTTTCVDRTAGTASDCTVNVKGTLLEQPPTQPIGGGFNSTLKVDLSGLPGGQLANGQSVEVRMMFGIVQTGHFRIWVNVEDDLVGGNPQAPGLTLASFVEEVIIKTDQAINFNPPASRTFGDPDFTVSATATSGLPVTFAAGGACTVGSTGLVHLTGAGACTIVASQAGDGRNNPAVDVARTVTIGKAASTTGVVSSNGTSRLAESVTFTATVRPAPNTPMPTGTVQFKDNGVNLGSPVAISGNGVAAVTTSTLTAGTHTITAEYSGNVNFNGSTGVLADQVVSNRPLVTFNAANYTVNQSDGFVRIIIDRLGDSAVPVTVDYATSDNGAVNCAGLNGVASQRCNFGAVFGTLRFAAGETQKTLDIPITQDAFSNGPQTFTVNLSNVTGTDATLVTPFAANVTINDSLSPTPNAIDDTTIFVRQQYRDFLNRDADPAGLAFWKDNIDKCNDPAQRSPGQTLTQCIEVQRITTSAAFFMSIEFRGSGGLVRDFYVAALDRRATGNMPNFVEFSRDTQAIQRGLIVGQNNWQQVLNANQLAFMNNFVTRSEFVGLYPTTDTPAQYVDKLYQHANVVPGSAQERLDALGEFGGAGTAADTGARARALLRITQNAAFQAREMPRAFVQMEYFGYLRRDANAPPDNNFNGYDFWVTKLNQFNGDFLQAEMVKAFLSSLEYRGRFGP